MSEKEYDASSKFIANGRTWPVNYIERIQIKDGVGCDVYGCIEDHTQDLAVVSIEKGCKTPLQKILNGDLTVEGYMSGRGTLTVLSVDGVQKTYTFDKPGPGQEVVVELGEVMQWTADEDSELVFYEICSPPYVDGRFENLSE